MGRSCACPPWHFTSASGEEPTTVMSPSSQKYIYGEGLSSRNARYTSKGDSACGPRIATPAPADRRRRRRCIPARAARRAACAASVSDGVRRREAAPRRRAWAPRRATPDHLAPQALPFGLAAVMQQRHAARQMIEHQQRTRRDVMRVRRLGGIEAASRHPLEVAHGIVGGIAHQAAEQAARRALPAAAAAPAPARRAAAKNSSLDRGRGRMHAADVESRRVQAHFETIAESDEGIARQPLASLDAFQQESRPKGASLRYADTGVSRSAAMSKGGFIIQLQISRTTKNPSPASRRRWVLDTDERLKLKRPAPTP
jgi:hypothetical protein